MGCGCDVKEIIVLISMYCCFGIDISTIHGNNKTSCTSMLREIFKPLFIVISYKLKKLLVVETY